MILVEQSEASSPSLASTCAKYYTKVISDKHEDFMARFGAAIGQGFIPSLYKVLPEAPTRVRLSAWLFFPNHA
jgi:hypothetical protein